MFSKFIRRLKGKFVKLYVPAATTATKRSLPQYISQRDLINRLLNIPHWEVKKDVYNQYEYSTLSGVWQKKKSIVSIPQDDNDTDSGNTLGLIEDGYAKVNYGCGKNLIKDWLNIDLGPSSAKNYYSANLLNKHPLPDDSVSFGFSEDVLEHLSQAESIFFLSEIYRSLKNGGVMRLSFPGLEGVLNKHYSPCSEIRVRQGEFEAYSFWDHIHFYSKEELKLVAEHIGFGLIEFVEYGVSAHPELTGLDTRSTQIGLNIYVELTKEA